MSLARYEAQRSRYFDKVEREYEREVARIYKAALDDIRKEMSKVYEKYAVDGVLTKAQMTQYNRLASIEKRILEIMKPANRAAVGIINKLRPEEYGEAFFRTAWAIDAETKLALNWGALNKDAILANMDSKFYDYAVKNLNDQLARKVYTAINSGLAMGQSYPSMMKDLIAFVNSEDFDLMRILRTELHTAQEAGTAAGYEKAQSQGVKGKMVWLATIDDRVRDTHAAMDGVAQDDDGYFRGPIGEARYPGDENLDAAERINCIPGDSIPIGIDTSRLYRRLYSGSMYIIKTASGNEVRVTPNHPVLTDRGWIPANLIKEGDNIISVRLAKHINGLDCNVDHAPPNAAKIFDLFRIVGIEHRTSGADAQFHGDGSDSDVDIISVNRKLWNRFQSAFYKPLIQQAFTLPKILQVVLSGYCALDKFLFGALHAAHGIMRGLCESAPLFLRRMFHAEVHRITAPAPYNSIFSKPATDDGTANVVKLCKRFFGRLSQVFLDKVVNVSKVDFSGHVYNLQSAYGIYGIYNGNGIMSMVHNCRCTMVFELDDVPYGDVPAGPYDEWKDKRDTWK